MVPSYNIGDQLSLHGEQYYVIEDSDSNKKYVTLLKANPLTVEEVNTYGGVGTENNHVNRYTKSNFGTAYNNNGYGAIAFYSSETCGYIDGSWVGVGCADEQANNYDTSDIKYVVDNWANAKFINNELVSGEDGYKVRLLQYKELHERLGYDASIQTNDGHKTTENVPTWIYKNPYWYWTMSSWGDTSDPFHIWCVTNSRLIYNYRNKDNSETYSYGVIRPVINVYKYKLSTQ